MESMSLLSVQIVYKYNLWLVVEHFIFKLNLGDNLLLDEVFRELLDGDVAGGDVQQSEWLKIEF